MAICFTYKKRSSASEITLFASEDRQAEDYRSLLKQVGQFELLYLSRSHHVHPFGHKETKAETDLRTKFDINKWNLIAAEYDVNARDGFASVFLVNKENKDLAFVIEMTGYQLVDSVFGEWAIEDEFGGVITQSEALDFFGYTNVNEKAEIKNERTSESPKVETPSFTPIKSGKPKNLDFIPKTNNEPAKPKPARKDEFIFHGKTEFAAPIENEDEEEEEVVHSVQIDMPSFVANSSKKPRNLDSKPFVKPAPISTQDRKEESPSQPLPTSFTPVSSRKPKNLDDSSSHWISVPSIRLYPDKRSSNARTILFDWKDEHTVAIFDKARLDLGGVKTLILTENCTFAPRVPEDSSWRKPFKTFHIDEWRILSMNIDAYNRPTALAISNIERAELCAVIYPNGRVLCVGFNGVSVHRPFAKFQELLERLLPPEPEPVTETIATPKVEPKELPPSEREPSPILEEDEVLEEHRRVFVTSSFLKDQDRFVRKYHGQAESDFEQTIRDLLSMDEEQLSSYLKRHDAKPILTQNNVTILKMRFGTSSEYEAARLFYCWGYDVKRKMNSSDLLLLGLTDQGEHEEQLEAGRLFARMFSRDDLVLFQQLLPSNKDDTIDSLAYMSTKQFSYLDAARESMPMAFLGSAGTGKTLLSLQHYLSLLEEGRKVLYLTYQKALCDEVSKTLKELRVQNVEAMTYRDLCFSIFGEEKAKAMRTKKRFRKWFMNYAKRTGQVQNKLRNVGPSLEDQFMICYVFYRGVIDGSKRNYASRRGAILSKEEFLDEVKDERGFSASAKETVYEVAVAYEKHLQSHQGTTDNKLAYEILSLGKKAQRYDAIVIDEFQDLSEIQFMAVISLLKESYPLPLFIYGDENQAINPTIFGYADAQTILYEKYGDRIQFKSQKLVDSYRSGPNLVHYINEVNRVKRIAIGAQSQREEIEVSLREDEEDLFATLVEGGNSLKELVRICGKSNKDVAFIFPSVLCKERAEKELLSIDEALVKSSFLSVEEAKGREWDSVVLVDFFSSSKELFDAMLGEERAGHQSTIHRMLFNRFYVALTRAQNRIVVYESNVSKLIRDQLLRGLTPLKEMKLLEEYFQGSAPEDSWKAFGLKLMHSRKYGMAYKAFSRCDDEESKKKAALCYRYIKAEQDELTYEEARDLYLEQLDYDRLQSLYDEHGMMEKKRFLSLVLESTDAEYVCEAYLSLEHLSHLEAKVFYCLCQKKTLQHLGIIADKLSRRS